MRVADLPLPERLIRHYHGRGIVELYPPQTECIARGVLEGKSLLIAIPTASGKTLIAEMAMHQHAAKGGKSLYIVPLKALASEKFEEFGDKGLRVGLSTGDFDRRDDRLGRNDIIVATSEKVDSLIRNSTPWLREITLLVVDEIHLLDAPGRGPALEMVIAKMRHQKPDLQIIALSATIGNPEELGGWLRAETVVSEWRPVELYQGVYFRGRIQFHGRDRAVETKSRFEDVNLVLDTIKEGGQCLVFVSSRRNAESLAGKVASALGEGSPTLQEWASRLQKMAETEGERRLADCVLNGAAFHHAGLRREARAIVEACFRRGEIKCIVSTPTLAAGLNLPARRVVIRDHHRYQSGEGMVPIPVMEYHQMAGRAGRPHLDPYGEAILIARSREDIPELFRWFIESPPERIRSRCATVWSLCSHILSIIATRFVNDRMGLQAFLQKTFYHHQKGDPELLNAILRDSLEYLLEHEMILTLGGRYVATEFGTLVSRIYLDPRSAELMVGILSRAEAFSTLGFLQMICSTPDMPTLSLRRGDEVLCERAVMSMGDELWVEMPLYGGGGNPESYFRSLKTAMLLYDWVEEAGEAIICERYSVGPGDIHTMVESVAWLIHAAGRLAHMFAKHMFPEIEAMELRIRYGVKRELLPLVRLKGIGRVRARRLFNNGIADISALRAAGIAGVTPILGAGLARQVFSQLDGQEVDEESGGLQTTWEDYPEMRNG
ncbi:MAG: ATP-dependent DNA helicase [Methanomicrobiales archaeon]|nr:ATP-dependent DNA helicase [Methanomicrobiales archaeon]